MFESFMCWSLCAGYTSYSQVVMMPVFEFGILNLKSVLQCWKNISHQWLHWHYLKMAKFYWVLEEIRYDLNFKIIVLDFNCIKILILILLLWLPQVYLRQFICKDNFHFKKSTWFMLENYTLFIIFWCEELIYSFVINGVLPFPI